MFTGEYSGYIFSCYAIVILVLVVLTLWIFLDEKKQQKLLKEFEREKLRKAGAKATGKETV